MERLVHCSPCSSGVHGSNHTLRPKFTTFLLLSIIFASRSWIYFYIDLLVVYTEVLGREKECNTERLSPTPCTRHHARNRQRGPQQHTNSDVAQGATASESKHAKVAEGEWSPAHLPENRRLPMDLGAHTIHEHPKHPSPPKMKQDQPSRCSGKQFHTCIQPPTHKQWHIQQTTTYCRFGLILTEKSVINRRKSSCGV